MTFTLFLLGREVFSVALELPQVPIISDLSSLIVSEATELEEVEEEYEEPESFRIGFQLAK